MFDKINLTQYTATEPLSSQQLTETTLTNPHYNRENLENSTYYIVGGVHSFSKPPITEFAKQNLFYMQDFNIFHYGKDSFTRRQNFHSFLILYTYEGEGSLDYRGKSYRLCKGDGAFINCMEPHYYRTKSNKWDTAVLHLDGPLLSYFHAQYINNGSAVFYESISGHFQAYLEQLLRIYDYPHLYRDCQASNSISNILTHLLILNTQNYSGNTNIPQNVQYLLKYMENNYTSRLTLDDLASFANMSKYHLAKEFKKYTGFSPNDYLISLRIEQAKSLLQTTNLPATKIAHQIGIHDLNNFTNLFKKKVGMTPIQFRKSTDYFS